MVLSLVLQACRLPDPLGMRLPEETISRGMMDSRSHRLDAEAANLAHLHQRLSPITERLAVKKDLVQVTCCTPCTHCTPNTAAHHAHTAF